jgi:hypothetical protein
VKSINRQPVAFSLFHSFFSFRIIITLPKQNGTDVHGSSLMLRSLAEKLSLIKESQHQ